MKLLATPKFEIVRISRQTMKRNIHILFVPILLAVLQFLATATSYADENEKEIFSGSQWSEQQMLASILKSAPTGIGVVENRVFKEVNDYIQNLTGYTREELIGHSIRKLYQTQEEFDKVGQELYAYLHADHKSVPVETRWTRKDGAVRHVSLTVAPLDPSDMAGKYTLTVLDVTERKHSEDRFAKAFRSSPAPLVVSEMDSGRFIDVNERWMEMLGYSREELIGRTSKEVGIWADPADRDRIVGILREHGSFKDEPVRFTTKSGGIIFALWSAEIISLEGRALLLSLIQDETARKQAEEALAVRTRIFLAGAGLFCLVLIFLLLRLAASLKRQKATAEELESFFSVNLDLLCIADMAGNFVKTNTAWSTILGYSTDELNNKNFLEFVHPDDLQATLDAMAILGKGEDVLNFTNRFRSHDGSYRHIEWRSHPKGNLIFVAARDVTERMRAEQEVVESRLLLQAVLDTIPVRVFWKDLNLRYIGCNKPFATDAGKNSPLELIGKDDSQMGWGDQAELYREDDRAVIESQIPKLNFEESQTTPEGTTSILRTSKIPLRNVHGHIVGVLGTYDDITDLKRAEAELKRLLEEQDILLSNIDAHVWYLKDMDTYGAVNAAHASFFGKDKSMLEYRSLNGVISSNGEVQVCTGGNRRVFEERRQIRTEEWMLDSRGESRLLAITKTPKLNESGAVEYVVCFANDITESKKMQEVLVQTEKMMSVGGMAAGIAHEINNPLGIVLQSVQNLILRTRPDFPKNMEAAKAVGLDMQLLDAYMRKRKLDVFIRDIESAAKRAALIIRRMLDFTRLSESKRAVCDPMGIVQNALALARSDYDLKKQYDFKLIEIFLDMDDDLPVVNCTETEIEQVVLNILRNAAQAMAEAKPPVKTPRITIRISALPDGIRIEIEDNGPGIPLEIQSRIFDPFFTTKPPGQGTGLGLSVSYFIITQGHGGQMRVESTPSVGTRFIIELPTEAAQGLRA